MRVAKYDMRVRENRIPYLVSVGRTSLTDEEMNQKPEKMVEIIRNAYHAECLPEEYLYMMTFDSKLHLIGLFDLSHGTCRESLISPAQVMQRGLLCGASSFCLAHNHPSGDVTPSREDDLITKRIAMAAQICGITFCDHLIIAGAHKNGFYSYRERTDLLD